jgi:hypothetical protein
MGVLNPYECQQRCWALLMDLYDGWYVFMSHGSRSIQVGQLCVNIAGMVMSM